MSMDYLSIYLCLLQFLLSSSCSFQCTDLSPPWINLFQNFHCLLVYCEWDCFLYFFFRYSNGIFHRNRKNNLKTCIEPQKIPNSNPEKEEESWRHHTSWFQTILLTIAIKTTWCWHKNRHQDQRNRIEIQK